MIVHVDEILLAVSKSAFKTTFLWWAMSLKIAIIVTGLIDRTMIFREEPMIRFYTLAVAVSFAAFTSINAWAADPLPTETHKLLPLSLAVEAAQAAISSCKSQGYNVTVSIVDRNGAPQLLLAGDGASVTPSRDLARRKAYTSAVRRVTTIELAKSVAGGGFNPTLYDTQMVTAGGGLPIKAGNETIGGIGVSGAPGGDKDEACASAGLDKIKDRLI
jgi:uncharacterized protein GlcG (DUF336 family)